MSAMVWPRLLHELGVLEVKKHNLDAAADFLGRALDLCRILDVGSAGEVVEADCAATRGSSPRKKAAISSRS